MPGKKALIVLVMILVVVSIAAAFLATRPKSSVTSSVAAKQAASKGSGGSGAKAARKNVTVSFIYVDIGDAIFIDTDGKDMLIDGGCTKCADAVSAYLAKLGKEPDIVVATHHDEDHIGGLLSLLSDPSIQEVWDNGFQKDTQTFRNYITLAEQKNFTVVQRGDVYWLDNETKITVLNPTQPPEFSDENDDSVVLRMDVGAVSFLFTGDCESGCEKSMMASGLNASAAVLKAGHHCSSSSTSNAFLDTVDPAAAVCLVGDQGHSRYGHPSQVTLDKFQSRGIAAYSTLDSGTIAITTDGADYSVAEAGR